MQEGQWSTGAAIWTNTNSIVEGCSNGLFGPDDPLTREQMAAILHRYAARKGYDVSAAGDLGQFSDAGSVSDWAADTVSWAVGCGLLSGKGDGVLDPRGNATRAEAASVLQRFMVSFSK